MKLILPDALVAGAPSLMRQLMGDGMLNRGTFAQRGPAAFGPEFGAQLLLEQLILADGQGSPVPELGCRALRSQGARVARPGRKLGPLAKDHGHRLPMGTDHLHRRKVQGEIMLGKQWTDLRPGAGNNVDSLCGPLRNPRARHVPQVDVELQQARGFLQLFRQQFHGFMLRRVRWAHHDLAGHFAVQVEQKVFLEAVEGFGTALATVTHRLVLNGNASIGRYMLFDPPPAWPTLGVW